MATVVVAIVATLGTGTAATRDSQVPAGSFSAPLFVDSQSVLNKNLSAVWPDLSRSARLSLASVRSQPTATWLTRGDASDAALARGTVSRAASADAVALLVLYDIPGRDCGGFSGGGAKSTVSYERWVSSIRDAMGMHRAVVIVEPDALAQLDCLTAANLRARLDQLDFAVSTLAAQGSWVYLDAGHAGWLSAPTMASRLQRAGVGKADGFSVNVASYGATSSEAAYGREISQAIPSSPRFVIDTSRNGEARTGTQWCNPTSARLGSDPTTRTALPGVAALLWIKTPGLSDGECNGGPAAGVFSVAIMKALVGSSP